MSAVLRNDVGAVPDFAPMRVEDIEEVVAVEDVIYPFPWTRGNFIDALRAGYSGWVWREAGEIVGYGVCMVVLDEVHLLNLSVAERWQRQGRGARLLRFLNDLYAASGCRQMLLEVRPSNAAALRLYRQFGFIRVGIRRGYYPAVGGREDAWVMLREMDRC